jgi:excinuclease ABC subunit A
VTHGFPRLIAVRGASEHNLKAVDVDIPRGALAVVTGVSGSGKSSLAFDTICAEGRRRYLETFSSYARQFLGSLSRPSVSHVDGISPAVSIEQSIIARNPRSTVGTMTELYDLLRLLWARCGTRAAANDAVGDAATETAGRAPLTRSLFSFNSPRGACPRCKGLGVEDRLDPGLLVAHPDRTIRQGALAITTPTGYLIYSQVTLDVLDEVCRAHGFSVDVPWQALTADERNVVLNGSDRIRIPYGKHPLASRLRWSGITARPREEGIYKGILPVMEQILRQKRNRNILRFVRSMPCRECGGTRLCREALAVRYRGLTIAQAAALPIDDLRGFFEEPRQRSRGGGHAEVEDAVGREVVARCEALQHLGLGYVALDRESTTLSGGEAQRIRLARVANIDLAGVLYVLDEPSIGLHPHDTARLLDVLRLVRARGNTVLVVEHDEQAIRYADWIVDVGPGAGDAGGEVLFNGPVRQFVAASVEDVPRLARSRTHAFLTGREAIARPDARRAGRGTLVATNLTKHNLQNVAVEFKLGAFNVVTGVSGAGKSTLVEETLRLLRDGPSLGATALASDRIDKTIEIDQAPIGRTPRSNPATYTGLFDGVRDLFARDPEAIRLGFGKGRFSFNVKGGRCESCEGAGVQQIGMQFLGTVSVICDACGGRRFNTETLRVRYRGKRIHDVLAMSIAEASHFFGDVPVVARPLESMRALGLGYLALGHPATMLSGGEAQRVKLAAELARPGTGRTLYVLDEPTTGLHAADIAHLLAAIDALVEKGSTVIAIEHDLDVIKVADWIVDLGPGGGHAGGRVVAMGTPEAVAADQASITGAELARILSGTPIDPSPESFHPAAPAPIRMVNVATHNLQRVSVEIPPNRLTVVTGVSGSGKSSLAFDTLFAEGQRRFADSFSTWARRLLRHGEEVDFDTISGLTPTIAVSQRAPSRNPRSTVATLTEIHDHYRLAFARAGTRFCPRCGGGVAGGPEGPPAPLGGNEGPPASSGGGAGPPALSGRLNEGSCPACGFTGTVALTASMFSPNSEAGACPRCKGLGHVLECDPARLVTDADRPLGGGAMSGHKCGRFYGDPHGQHVAILTAAGKALGIDFSVPWSELGDKARTVAMRGAGDGSFDVEWHYARGARRGTHRFQSTWPGFLEYVRQEYERKHADRRGEALEPLMVPVPCAACGGGKLKPEALAVRFGGVNIRELLAKSVEESLAFFDALESIAPTVDPRDLAVTRDLRAELVRRLRSLSDAGLDYLTLDRPAATLSGGEAQRTRLATELGSGLVGITYVLDEPTIGLHPRDTDRLVGLLRALRDAGNTVVVVEHDLDVIAAADHIIEVGPGAGTAGGRIVASGTPGDIARDSRSRTARHLGPRTAPAVRTPRSLGPGIDVRGATAHNLRNIDVAVPAGGLVVLTGVSGSGKSSLAFDVIAPSVERMLARPKDGAVQSGVNCREITVHPVFAGLVRVAPGAVPSSPWSTVATSTGLFDHVRELFARTEAAAARDLRRQHFSAQVKGGRCERCEGIGQTRIAMDFLPDVWMTCEECGGRRYGPAVLACTIDGQSIADVLDATVDRSRAWFAAWRDGGASHVDPVVAALEALDAVGLGYLRLGQPVRTLSGGERQRLVLAAALIDRTSGARLFLFDEPTTGLHADDVERLLGVFDRLIDAGHSLVAIEHHLDVVAHADWVIDLGPEGGNRGGNLVVAGPPAAIAGHPGSLTGQALARRRSWA